MDQKLWMTNIELHNAQTKVNLELAKVLLELAKVVKLESGSPALEAMQSFVSAASEHADMVGALAEKMELKKSVDGDAK